MAVAIDLAGRSAVVTGGAGGLGRAIGAALARAGARVALWDLDAGRAAEAAAALPAAGHLGIACDVTDAGAVAAAAAATVAALGPVAVLVNNAGAAGPTGPAAEMSAEVWRAVHALNLDSVHLVSQAFAPGMVAQGWGRIVNIASVAAKEGNAGAAAYSSAKAGVVAYTKSLGKELAATGVLVNCITPAALDTAFFDTIPAAHRAAVVAKIPMGRMGQPEEAADLVLFLASELCRYSTGAVFDLSGGRATY
jgi:3-oxoacyl-[acyl-carrier protein] reductase